jgi:lysophospholipase L1-like esterase
MSTRKVSGTAQPQKVDSIQLRTSENRARLAQHMSVLQGFGYTDLSTLGKLTVGTKGVQNLPILQKNGVLLPSAKGGALQDKVTTLTNDVRPNVKTAMGSSLKGSAFVTNSTNLTSRAGGQVISLNIAYWFGTHIDLQDDTTIVLAADVKSLVIIAETLTIGQRVKITWERPAEALVPAIPQKPNTPPDLEQASTIGSERGTDGYPGIAGGQGTHGQLAPELELWFLQSTGFPMIDLRGQDGFLGGRGGDGGNGGRGQKGCNTEKKLGVCSQEQGGGGNGGNGNRAGDGGTGGNGGDGGKFKVFTPQPVINAWLQSGLTISVDGGDAGSGGDAGRPGEGGPGGDKGDRMHKVCSENQRTAGAQGASGAFGNRGQNGKKGNLLPNSIQYSAISPSDFYMELTKPAVVSVYPQTAYVGDTISVNGLRFVSGDKVLIAGYDGIINVPCPTTFVSDSLLTFTVPSVSGGFALLEVVQTDGTRSSSKGTLLIRPRIDSLIPAGRIKPGQSYFISGKGLGKSGNIWINGEDIGAFKSVNNTTIKFKARRPSNAEFNPDGERVKLKVVNAEGIGATNPNHSAEIDVVLDTYVMLVCGDSVMWGGGLPERLKFYSLAADYVSAKMENVMVYSTIKAHHGAKIGRNNTIVKDEMNGEMSSRWPTILQQVETLSTMPNADEVDLIIITGGANDLPITDVMLLSDSSNLETEKDNLRTNTRQYCFDDMVFMLQKVVSQFPKAKVIVTGYFHIFSEESNPDFVKKLLLAAIEDVTSLPIWSNSVADTQRKIVALSNVWVTESNKNLAEAVKAINNSIMSEPRVFFVNPDTLPVNAAHAPNSLLWEPDMLGGPTDPMWKGGRQQQRDLNEARLKSEGSTLLNGHFMTKANSSYHPNPAGAQRYFQKMKPVLDLAAQATRVAIRANNGRYICAEGGGNGTLTGDRVTIGAWETFEMMDLGSNRVALKSVNGMYVCADNGGGTTVLVNRWRIGAWETFKLVPQATGVAFQTADGHYLSVPMGATNVVTAGATQVLAGEIFTIL